jgi:hypothetical protein
MNVRCTSIPVPLREQLSPLTNSSFDLHLRLAHSKRQEALNRTASTQPASESSSLRQLQPGLPTESEGDGRRYHVRVSQKFAVGHFGPTV